MATPDTLIERYLPIDEISVEGIRECAGAIPNPAPHQLHVWWARRPLAISRAAVAASLLPSDTSQDDILSILGTTEDLLERKSLMDQAASTGSRERIGYSGKRSFTHNPTAAQQAMLRSFNPDPIVLDITAGGGSIPFEAGRLGLRTIANELNPVACLILRATCQWPQEFGHALLEEYENVSSRFRHKVDELVTAIYPSEQDPTPEEMQTILQNKLDSEGKNRTAPAVMRAQRYRDGYLWARTTLCPSCDGVIPLSPKWRLNAGGKGIKLLPDTQTRTCGFTIVDTPEEHSQGTINRAIPTCPYPDCGATAPKDYITKQAQAGRLGQQMYAISYRDVYWFKSAKGKERKGYIDDFRVPTSDDDNSPDVTRALADNAEAWQASNILPNETVPQGDDNRPHQYDMGHWIKMFSPRQQLAHGYCVQAFHELVDEDAVREELTDPRKVAWCYVAIALDKMLNRNARLARWIDSTGTAGGVFDRHDFRMVWSHVEIPVIEVGRGLGWATTAVGKCLREIIEMAGHESVKTLVPRSNSIAPPTEVISGPAQFMYNIPDGSIDCIVFDPPYHNNVNYAELSDFFYVWLKRTAGYVMPELFPDYLTDKDNEAIASPARFRQQVADTKAGNPRAKVSAAKLATEDYLDKMAAIFRECRRVIKPSAEGGKITVMFSHQNLTAWESLITALIESHFTITRVWPIKTESESSLHIKDRAAARTTMLIACRPRDPEQARQEPRPWAEVESEICHAVQDEIPVLASYNFKPVDIYNAAYGPALRVISENWGARRQVPHPERLTDDDPFHVTPTDALEVARREVTHWRMAQISKTLSDSHPDPATAFYILSQDGTGSTTMPFDEANLFAKAIGIDLNHPYAKRIADKKGSKVTLASAKQRLARGDIDSNKAPVTVLDQVHTAIALTERAVNSEKGEEWLTWNGIDHRGAQFKGTLESLLTVLKPRHDDYDAGHALHLKLYAKPHQPQAEQVAFDLTLPQAPIDGGKDRLVQHLRWELNETPFENGIGHPAEGIIATAIEADPGTIEWLLEIANDESDADLAAATMLCIARQEAPSDPGWQAELVKRALATSSLTIRDAAVQAAEAWPYAGVVAALREHDEPEAWLRDYIDSVVHDLEREIQC